jgi:hypothetical protein
MLSATENEVMVFSRVAVRSIGVDDFVSVDTRYNMRISSHLTRELELLRFNFAQLWDDPDTGRFALSFYTDKTAGCARLYKQSDPLSISIGARKYLVERGLGTGRYPAHWDESLGLLVCEVPR